ncbi:DsbA family oxidoreductase [Nostoc favosum]|uniref:DsbA family protein n=1 Tax=Nostoc favosum CHAB5714 TaxID=2780399 RepID=A0ABS8IDQ8_9NOSO|nr:DsbA family protein [Nostoc favosum]MCC5601904.1 DsbA family protein [Nostoc favosum CHAB5714]
MSIKLFPKLLSLSGQQDSGGIEQLLQLTNYRLLYNTLSVFSASILGEATPTSPRASLSITNYFDISPFHPQNPMEPIRIFCFSDVLCIWAYIAQIRLDELKTTFQDKIAIEHHFVPIFGIARERLNSRWRDRGGLQGYSDHIQEVAKKFDHISVHPDIWIKVTPPSSTSCHLFLHAIQLLEAKGLVEEAQQVFEKITWAFRKAFFTQLANVSDRKVQFEIAEELRLPIAAIQAQIDSGEAYAQLFKDFELVKDYTVTVSPTLIFNEGRQRLNGNVGYRVIEANIRELLHNPLEEQSWC